MTTSLKCLRIPLFSLLLLNLPLSGAQEVDPQLTGVALQALLSASNVTIPRNSSCFANYPGTNKPTIKDLLATRLAYLHRGENVIQGSCKKGHCELIIRHSAGEDVASANIKFSVTRGQVDMRSLNCLMTP